MFKALALLTALRPYMPIVLAVLRVLKENRQLIEGLQQRPHTTPERDARDAMRKLDGHKFWKI